MDLLDGRPARGPDEVEALIGRTFPHAEIIIHEDPAGIEERVTFPARQRAL